MRLIRSSLASHLGKPYVRAKDRLADVEEMASSVKYDIISLSEIRVAENNNFDLSSGNVLITSGSQEPKLKLFF